MSLAYGGSGKDTSEARMNGTRGETHGQWPRLGIQNLGEATVSGAVIPFGSHFEMIPLAALQR